MAGAASIGAEVRTRDEVPRCAQEILNRHAFGHHDLSTKPTGCKLCLKALSLWALPQRAISTVLGRINKTRMWFLALVLAATANAAASPPLPDCVILLHGLARTSRSMLNLEAALFGHGYDVANVDYPSRKFEIEKLAEIAIGNGLTICGEGPNRKIHFVTHSLGGILVRYYLVHHKILNLGRTVMLAPPNRGSEVVDQFSGLPGYRLINGPAGAQLGTKSSSIPLSLGSVNYPVGVIAGTRSINPILSTALPNPNDGKVALERAKVEGMTDFLAVPVSHPFIMKDPAVIKQVINFIEGGAFVHEGP